MGKVAIDPGFGFGQTTSSLISDFAISASML